MAADLEGADSINDKLEQLADRWGDKTVIYLVTSNAEYAAFVEFGTDPHVITADNKDALKFEVGGETVFATSVDHPGTEAQPYMRPAVRAVERSLPRIADKSDSLEEFVRDTARTIEREAKIKAPRDTGNLRAKIKSERVA